MSPINGGFIRGNEVVDNLLVGDFHFTDTETLDENQDLERGAVLGRITASGKMILSIDTAVDGSETPEMVLLDDAVTAAAENLNIPVLVFGQVNEEALSFGGAHDKTTVKAPLKANGVYTVKSRPG